MIWASAAHTLIKTIGDQRATLIYCHYRHLGLGGSLMLFELMDNRSTLKPVAFQNFRNIKLKEKHLEDLLAEHLFQLLFQETPLLPFHQERPHEAVADIYALNQNGDVVIFELKRDAADSCALDQLLRYAGEAGLWSYSEIERRYRRYSGTGRTDSLKQVHALTFNLEPDHELHEDQFNRQQHLWVVGSAAADNLIRGVDYWKSKGLCIDFFPYRVYQLGGKEYLEFFAKPYDQHINPAFRKGVLFDTNRTWAWGEEEGYGCLKDMLDNSRVSAYGERKEAVLCFQTNDYVFYSHVGRGIVGAARVRGRTVKKIERPDYDYYEWFWDVELLTPVPTDYTNIPAMSFGEVIKLLGHGFFWARTDKYPYLRLDESELLADELIKILKPITEPAEAIPTSQSMERGFTSSTDIVVEDSQLGKDSLDPEAGRLAVMAQADRERGTSSTTDITKEDLKRVWDTGKSKATPEQTKLVEEDIRKTLNDDRISEKEKDFWREMEGLKP